MIVNRYLISLTIAFMDILLLLSYYSSIYLFMCISILLIFHSLFYLSIFIMFISFFDVVLPIHDIAHPF